MLQQPFVNVISVNLNDLFQKNLVDKVKESKLEINLLTAVSASEAMELYHENDVRAIMISVPFIGGYEWNSWKFIKQLKKQYKGKIILLYTGDECPREFQNFGCLTWKRNSNFIIEKFRELGLRALAN